MTGVEVAGVGLHPFGRFGDKSAVQMGAEAVQAALADAGAGRGDFQKTLCASVYGGVAMGHRVLGELGLTGGPIVNVEAGCASGGAALMLAIESIRSGECDGVLVVGVEKMVRGMIRSSFFEPWHERSGLSANPAYFALRARRLMEDSGVTVRQLAEVSAKNHGCGVHNPHAMYRKELSAEEVLASPLVCDPLTRLMLCAPNEGAAAVLLRRATRPGGVRIAGAALRSHRPGNVLGEHTPLCGRTTGEPPSPTEESAAAAYDQAALGPGEIDVAEVQDTDSARELLSYEELGFCSRGTAGAWFAAGNGRPGSRLPVNVSGGLLSKGEPLGASALGQVVELVWQLRGEAGRRQVEGARTALAHTVGRGANACVVVLQRD